MKHLKPFNEALLLGENDDPIVSQCISKDGSGKPVIKMETQKGKIYYSDVYSDDNSRSRNWNKDGKKIKHNLR